VRLVKKLGQKWLVYSFSVANRKVDSLPDFNRYFQVTTPLGRTMHVNGDDIGLSISQGPSTIIISVSETAEESGAKVDALIKALDAREMPVPMHIQTGIDKVIALANQTPNPEDFFKKIFG